MSNRELVRRKKTEIVSFLNENNIVASVGIIKAELGDGLKISFREQAPTSVCKMLTKILGNIPVESEIVGIVTPRRKIIE